MLANNPMTPLCGAKARTNGGMPCKRLAGPNGRCANHGGKSTGPRTFQGKSSQKEAVWKHGMYSKEIKSEMHLIQNLLKKGRCNIKNLS